DYATFAAHIVCLVNNHSGQFEIDSSYDLLRKSKMQSALHGATAEFHKQADTLAASDTFVAADIVIAVSELCGAALTSFQAAVQENVLFTPADILSFVRGIGVSYGAAAVVPLDSSCLASVAAGEASAKPMAAASDDLASYFRQ